MNIVILTCILTMHSCTRPLNVIICVDTSPSQQHKKTTRTMDHRDHRDHRDAGDSLWTLEKPMIIPKIIPILDA